MFGYGWNEVVLLHPWAALLPVEAGGLIHACGIVLQGKVSVDKQMLVLY